MSAPRAGVHDADSGQRGIVLADALVAIGVLAIVLTLSARATQDGLRRTVRSEAIEAGELEARSRLASVGSEIPIAPGTLTGEDGALRWRVDMVEAASAAPSLVTVTVAVTNAEGRALAHLTTLRAAR